MMQFYMTPGSCSTGIHILLEELELVFGVNLVNLLAGDNQSDEFLRLNPKGSIPVLVTEENLVLADFVAIAWWLAERHPKAKLLPESPDRRAECLEWLNYTVGHIHGQGFTRIFTPERYLTTNDGDRDPIISQGQQMVDKGFALISRKLHPQSYVFDRFSIADAALFYVEFWASRTEISLPGACQAHLELMQRRPVVQRVLAEEGYRV